MLNEAYQSETAEKEPVALPIAEFHIDLKDLEPVRVDHGGRRKMCESASLVTSGGKIFDVRVKEEIDLDASGRILSEDFSVIAGESGSRVIANLAVAYPSSDDLAARASTDVLKQDPGKKLPLELGVNIYEKILDLLEDLAKKRNVPISHLVTMALNHSKTPLTEERWRQIFEPILKRRGYIRTEEKNWHRIYPPK